MSRNMQVIDEIIETAISQETYRLEDVCGDAAERLLNKHEYTSRAEVRMEAEFVIEDETPASGLATQGTADVIASATATDEGTREEIGATVTGMTVCPCSQGMSEARARETLRDMGVESDVVEEFLEEVPQPGHSQRGHATLTVEDEGAPDVDLNDLIDVARDAMSARIYNLAKRPDEDVMTYRSHADAKFVEDCVRSMAEGVVDEFGHLPDDAVVRMEQVNDESIHQHDAHAERVVEMGQLRREVERE
jgi:GTP cyclohydrolase-4